MSLVVLPEKGLKAKFIPFSSECASTSPKSWAGACVQLTFRTFPDGRMTIILNDVDYRPTVFKKGDRYVDQKDSDCYSEKPTGFLAG